MPPTNSTFWILSPKPTLALATPKALPSIPVPPLITALIPPATPFSTPTPPLIIPLPILAIPFKISLLKVYPNPKTSLVTVYKPFPNPATVSIANAAA